jgi:hypothetical protein
MDVDSWEALETSGYSMFLNYTVTPKTGTIYAVVYDKQRQTHKSAGKVIMGASDDQYVKYLNGDTLDLRKANLRLINMRT